MILGYQYHILEGTHATRLQETKSECCGPEATLYNTLRRANIQLSISMEYNSVDANTFSVFQLSDHQFKRIIFIALVQTHKCERVK